MPVVKFNRKTLEKAVGKKLTEEDLRNKVPMVGCDLESINKEEVEYEVFPDRPDMLSMEGFARTLSYFFDIKKGIPKYSLEDSGIKIKTGKVEARPHITGAVVKNIEITEEVLKSLMQVQEKIHKTFGRERRKIAVGIHDLDKIKPPFTYKAVNPDNYSFVPLEWNEELTLKQIQEKHEKGRYADILEEHKKWPVITDSEGYTLSFPPVINGKKTEVTEKTKNLFIDITGTDEEAIEKALNIIVTSLAERKAEIQQIEVEGKGKRPNLTPEEIQVDYKYINKLLGENMTEKEVQEKLEGVGFEYISGGKVKIPPYRADIMHPIDIVEEVAIKKGYKNFKPILPDVPTTAKPDKGKEKEETLKELFMGLGYQEVKNTVLSNKAEQFKKMKRSEEEVVELQNPLNVEHTLCRMNLLPQLLKNISNNQHEPYPQKIFEVGKCVEINKKKETGANTFTKVAAVKTNNQVNYNEATAVLDAFLKNLGISYDLRRSRDPSFIPGRRASIICHGRELGVVGEVHPQVLNNFGIDKPVIALEIDWKNL